MFRWRLYSFEEVLSFKASIFHFMHVNLRALFYLNMGPFSEVHFYVFEPCLRFKDQIKIDLMQR